jgi:hypothetical protein
MPRVIGTLTGHHVDAPFVIHHLWSIIGDSDGVVSFILPSVLALLSFHMSTGKLGSRPGEAMGFCQGILWAGNDLLALLAAAILKALWKG